MDVEEIESNFWLREQLLNQKTYEDVSSRYQQEVIEDGLEQGSSCNSAYLYFQEEAASFYSLMGQNSFEHVDTLFHEMDE